MALIGVPATRARVVVLQSPSRDIAGGLIGLVQILEPSSNLEAHGDGRTSLLLLTDDTNALFTPLKRASVEFHSELTSYEASRTSGTTYAFTVADRTGVRITFAQLGGLESELFAPARR